MTRIDSVTGFHGGGDPDLQEPRRDVDPGDTSVGVIESTIAAFARVLPARAAYVEDADTDEGYLLGLVGARWRWYRYEGGLVRIGAAVADGGGVTVALVFGPDAWFDDEDWGRILDSIVPFE